MAEKLIIVMANTDPRNGEELGAPIFQATVAAAMDYEVDVICTATSGKLMKKGVAETLVRQGRLAEVGLQLYSGCPRSRCQILLLFAQSRSVRHDQDDLIPECEGIVGGAHLIEQVMEEDCKVLTY